MIRLLFDTNLLMRLCHPRVYGAVEGWLEAWIAYSQRHTDMEILIAAPADFELRRGYLYALQRTPDRLESRIALMRLNELCEMLSVAPVRESTWELAAQLWAEARLKGFQTAPDHHIDWDVIIASQALELGATVVTSNARHFTCYGAEARDWPDLPAPTD